MKRQRRWQKKTNKDESNWTQCKHNTLYQLMFVSICIFYTASIRFYEIIWRKKFKKNKFIWACAS